jgi:hypothetical protein
VSPARSAVAPTVPSLLYIAPANSGKAAANAERIALLDAMALAAMGRYACGSGSAMEISRGRGGYRDEVRERRGEHEEYAHAEGDGGQNGNYPVHARVRCEREPVECCIARVSVNNNPFLSFNERTQWDQNTADLTLDEKGFGRSLPVVFSGFFRGVSVRSD